MPESHALCADGGPRGGSGEDGKGLQAVDVRQRPQRVRQRGRVDDSGKVPGAHEGIAGAHRDMVLKEGVHGAGRPFLGRGGVRPPNVADVHL